MNMENSVSVSILNGDKFQQNARHGSFILLDVCFLSMYQVMYMIALEKTLV